MEPALAVLLVLEITASGIEALDRERADPAGGH
jgi:hypothetical protein